MATETTEKPATTKAATPADPDDPKCRTALLKALISARKEMVAVKMSGKNEFDNYEYATLEDYLDVLDEPLHKHGLFLLTNVEEIQQLEDRKTRNGGVEHAIRIRLNCELMHANSGQSLSIRCYGEGQDRADKAIYKAITGARKYAIASIFNLCTSADPEADETVGETRGQGSRKSSGGKKEEPRRSAPAAKPPSGNIAPRAQAPTDKVAVARSWISSCTALADMTKLLRDLQKTDKPEFKVGTPGYQAVIDEAGKHAELMLQSGKWQEDYCGDLWTLLEAMKKAIDTDQQAKGLF